jgi:hypothetical protein
MVECYSADSLEANDCLSFDEMTDYQHNPYTFAYESCEHKAPYPDLYTDCCNVYIGSDNSTAASPDKCSDKYPHDPTTSMGNLQYDDQVTCDEACHCEFNWDYKKCLDISEAKYDREVLGNDPYEIVYMDKEPNTVPMYDTIWDAFQYCSQQYQESCCNSIVDSEGLVDSNGNRNQLCEFVVQGSYTFYNSSGGEEIENYGYCMPDAKQTFLTGKNNGTCKTSENCGCTKNGAVEFKTSNDEKCPHVQKCYLPVQDQCGAYEYDGLWSTVDTEGNYGKAYWQMYRSGSLYCKNTGGSVPGGPHKYHFTSIDQQSTGCGGFTMTFGCDTEDDQTLVGDMLKTNLAMYAYCDGSDEDECRRCNIFNLFERGDAANMYASGDYSESTNQDKDMLMDAQTRIFVALLLICFMKEMLGVAIMAVTYKVNGCIDPDIDYVTVGKDSIAGLAFLLVALYNMENNADRMLYAERYKSYMDGYSPEEIRENKHRRHEKEWKLAESDYLRRKARRQRRIDKGEEPGKEIEMPEILTQSVDAMDKEKTSIDSTGRVSIVLEDDLDIMPLIEPQTILFKLWVVFEFVESIAGLMFGLLFFFRLASINKPEDVPSYSAAASALVAALSSWCDLILNIIGHSWNPRGWIKYVNNKHIINLLYTPDPLESL